MKKELGPDAIILGNKQIAISPNESYVEVMAAAEPEPAAAPLSSQPAAGDAQIHNDIQEIKGFLSLLVSSKDHFYNLQMKEPVAEIYHSLITRGVDEKQAFMLLSRALSNVDLENPSKREVMDALCSELFEKVRLARPFQNLSSSHSDVHTFAFLGPTGVGKTTTLAKLAAYLKIKRQMEIGLISLDTYRIGAVDQLQTYANILDVPLIVAQNKTELQHARDQFRHHDMILVDTTGKNFLNRQHIQDLQAVFNERDSVQRFLVLSATTKDEDLKQTIMHFRSMNIHSLIFTKVDETLSHGSMLNQLLRFPYPVSYLGTGQRVPEDIELATPKRLLSFLFAIRK